MNKKRAALLVNIDCETDPESIWNSIGNLGEGSFGMVQKVEHKDTKKLAAAKVIPVKYEEELEDFVVEVNILTDCKHPGIVELVGAYFYKSQLWVMLELCEGGAVDDVLIELEAGLSEPQIVSCTNQLTEGLICLHANGIIHRDLKAGNVLLKADGTVKLTDFGVSAKNAKLTDKRDTFIGTPYWMAPEVVLCENSKDKPYDYMSDIWSFGITLIELAETNPPYSDMHPMRVLFKIPKALPPVLTEQSKWSNEFHQFLALCLKREPNERTTAKGLAEHPFIKGKTDKGPVRDLYRLFNAEVTEVVEDLPEAEVKAMQATKAIGEIQSETTPIPSTEPSKSEPQLSPPTSTETSDGKTFKTLSRTRQYVNEAGEIITISTQRVVETGVQSGKIMTIRKGMTNIDSDWKDAEAKKLALLRKAQLKETKLIQREEQKECNEHIAKLQAERESWDAKQKAEVEAFEKEAQKSLVSQQKVGASEKAKQEKAVGAQLASMSATVKSEMDKSIKAFKANKAKEMKAFLKELDATTPKADRKSAKESAKAKNDEDEKKFIAQAEQAAADKNSQNQYDMDMKLRKVEEELLLAEQTVIRNTATQRREMVERHMQEKQQMLKHQLKATFWMQKHQMHYRHEKECDQLRKLQQKKVAGLQKKFMVDQKTLPRKQRESIIQKKKELKKQLGNSKEQMMKLAELAEDEQRRSKAEAKQMEINYTTALAAMTKSMKQETEELRTMQGTKKQLLVGNEASKVSELDSSQAKDFKEFQQKQQEIMDQLIESLETQMKTHKSFYDGQGDGGDN